jgi:hypothetical protein
MSLPSKHEALSSNPRPQKNEKEKENSDKLHVNKNQINIKLLNSDPEYKKEKKEVIFLVLQVKEKKLQT